MTIKLLMGNEAFAWAALEAGVNVVAGYPGTPSSELVETVARLHAEGTARGVHVEWSTNEKAALEVAAAASYCGARALFTCKQVGLNVASDALMSLNYVGTGGGLVLFVADDPGPISSQTEQDTRRFAAFAKVPVLDPSTPEEGYAMMRQAFELSERYGTPVIVRPTTRICHASTFFELPEFTDARPIPEQGFQKDPKWIIFPKRAFEGHGEVNRRLARIAWDYAFTPEFAQFNHVVEEPGSQQLAAGSDANATWVEAAAQSGHGHGGTAMPRGKVATSGESDVLAAADSNEGAAARVGIVAGGVSAQYAREALALLQQWAAEAGAALPPYRFLAVGTPYQCGYCTPDGKGLMIGFRNSELAPQTWEALEEKGWKDLCKSVLSIEEQEALNKQLERMAPISVFDYPEKTHRHDDFIHLIMFAVAPDAQGTGVARKVLEPFFKLADEENLPIYLETYSNRLEGLYKHFGFEMVREYRSPEFAVYERVMVRKPGGER